MHSSESFLNICYFCTKRKSLGVAFFIAEPNWIGAHYTSSLIQPISSYQNINFNIYFFASFNLKILLKLCQFVQAQHFVSLQYLFSSFILMSKAIFLPVSLNTTTLLTTTTLVFSNIRLCPIFQAQHFVSLQYTYNPLTSFILMIKSN